MKKIALLASPERFDYWFDILDELNPSISLTPSKRYETCDIVIIHTSFHEENKRLYEKIMSNNDIKKILFGGSKHNNHSDDRNLLISDDVYIKTLIKFL